MPGGESPDPAPVRPMPGPAPALATTPLDALHRRLGAKMVGFAGYDMPLHYSAGLLREHLHVRQSAGLFDVSHMGQIAVVARSGVLADAARALEALLPIDVLGLAPGRQRYGFFTDAEGGILDDLMVANPGDRFVLVVNAARKVADEAHLRAALSETCVVTVVPRALIALQGPRAEAVLAGLSPEVAAMRFMDVRDIDILGASCLVMRAGYTGEDGFEIAVAVEHVEAIAEALLADPAVMPIGLGARDSLRLEAGLCLYGSDMDATTTPVAASLAWAISPARRRGGAREGGFPGAARILDEMAGGTARRRVGLRPEGRAPVRAGAPLFAAETGGEALGVVTSGGFGPSLQAPVAMGYILASRAEIGARLHAEVRGQRLPVVVSKLPFVPAGFKRG